MDGTADTAVEILNRRFMEDQPVEAASQLEELPASVAAGILTELPPAVVRPVLEGVSTFAAAVMMEEMDAPAAAGLLEGVTPAWAVAVLGQMDEDTREAVVAAARAGIARDWRVLMAYPPESAGRAMDRQYVSFREGMTAGDAMARIRRYASRAGIAFFVLDADGRLRSRVGLKELALADPAVSVDELAVPVSRFVEAQSPRTEVAEQMRSAHTLELPAIDADGKLIGVIRYAALVDAIRDEATVDIQTMFGASKDERALSPALFAVRRRLPWMQINLLTAFLAAAVVGAFESTIAKYTALAVLLPVVAGQSGNAGAQALAVTIRGIALREIGASSWLRLASKELRIGLINGIVVALTTGVAVIIWSGSLGLAGVIFFSMIISMLIAGLAGAMVPIALSRLGQDPAQSSSIVLTTITDIAGFMSFLGIATIFASTLPAG